MIKPHVNNPVNKVNKKAESTAAVVSSDRSKESLLNTEKKLRVSPFTGDFKCSYITTEAIIGFFFNSYLPE